MRIAAGGTILLSVCSLAAAITDARAWQTNLDFDHDTARAVAFHPSGNVVMVGDFGFSSLTGIFTVAMLANADGAPMWQSSITGTEGTGHATALAIDPISVMDPIGFITVAGSLDNSATGEDFAVLKLVPFDGSVLWRTEIDGPPGGGRDRALAIALDSIDVVAGGYSDTRNLFVVKLDGGSGAELWRWPLVVTRGRVEAVAVNSAASMAVAVGNVHNSASGLDLLVVALDLATGAELWQRQISGSALRDDTAHSVAIDPSDGSVAVAGVVEDDTTSDDFFVVKFDAAGTELWRRAEDGTHGNSDVAYAVAIDPSGDVIAAGALDNLITRDDLAVFKYAGAGGGVLWQRQVAGTRPGDDRANALRIDASGDVFVAGLIRNHPGNDFDVIKWANDGTPVWRREINGDDSSSDEALAVAVEGAEVAAAGSTRNVGTHDDATIVKLSSTDGSGIDYHPTSGKRLIVRDKQSDPTKRKVLLVSNTDVDLAAGDPADPTFTGATLELHNPATGETDVYSLPPTYWLFRTGGPFKPDRYTYTDLDQVNGPCKRVVVRRGKNLRAVCVGAQIAYTLDEATQDLIEVRLHLGSDPIPLCMAFGGTVLTDRPTAGTHLGYFRAIDSKAGRCSLP